MEINVSDTKEVQLINEVGKSYLKEEYNEVG